ncbi:hypothetical protein [Streptomyces iconiensis]|uniref:Uncharacterized protein n=1 Tax=Streptomyces iconiensis TaxID=1384038 RepID=A0ABT7A5I7_9ACTN|nr:hypothetical protein [Streptomyces iconiensis]MDJ1136284.1 hypothetical protein [Streptomyces iconiensis]
MKSAIRGATLALAKPAKNSRTALHLHDPPPLGDLDEKHDHTARTPVPENCPPPGAVRA